MSALSGTGSPDKVVAPRARRNLLRRLDAKLSPYLFISPFFLVFGVFGLFPLGYTAYVWLVQNVSLGTVATYAYVNPLVAITLGILFLDEVITWQIAAGAAVILTSVAVVIRREVPRRPEAVIPRGEASASPPG